MEWLIGLSLFLSFAAVLLSVYSYLTLSKKLEQSDITNALKEASDGIMRTASARIKDIETEWDNMYSKFASLAGRIDRKKALATPPTTEPIIPPARTRADILRRRRSNVEASLS